MRAFIGIDIGGTNLRFGLVTEEGGIAFQARYPSDIHLGFEDFLGRLIEGIEDIVASCAENQITVAGIGIGVPGLVANDGTILSSVNMKPLEGKNLKHELALFFLPVFVANDANAHAYGEKVFGAGKDIESLLLLTLGTGVGSGLILNGKLWTGSDGYAGEFGHVTVEPGGLECGCGNNGCLEQYASATAITRKGLQWRRFLEIDEEITAEVVAREAHNGNALARSIFEDVAEYIGIATASAINLLNLEAIIIAGGVSASFDLLEEKIRSEIKERTFSFNGPRVHVLKGLLGDDAGILGSAALAMDAA